MVNNNINSQVHQVNAENGRRTVKNALVLVMLADGTVQSMPKSIDSDIRREWSGR